MDAAALQATLDGIAADYVKRLRPARRVGRAGPGDAQLAGHGPSIVHAGGVLCGQAIMAAADTAMLLAMIAQLGEFRPMTTVQLQTSFVRPVPKDAIATRSMRRSAVGQDVRVRRHRVHDRRRVWARARDHDLYPPLADRST